MSQVYTSTAIEVRRKGAEVVDAVVRGDPTADAMLQNLSRLPRSDARHLAEMVLTMCEAEGGKRGLGASRRLHEVGVRAACLFGLSFEDEIISTRLAPALIRLLKEQSLRDDEAYLSKPARYDRVFALALLSPRLDPDVAFSALRACFMGARVDGVLDADLVIPIAGFESLFRKSQFDWHGEARERARLLCLEAVRSRLETTVEALTEADSISMDEVIREVPLAHAAAVAFLTLLPTIVASENEEISSKARNIVYNAEFIASRGRGYPGSFFHQSDIGVFDQLRSLLSLGVGVLALKDTRYAPDIMEMRLARQEGEHSLGTAVLHFARHKTPDFASDVISAVVAGELGLLQRPDAPALTRMGAIELSALAWYFDIRQPLFLRAALERLREPRGQFYLIKALAGDPWVE